MKRFAAFVCLFSICSCSGITCDQNRHRAIRHMNQGVKNFSDGVHAEALSQLKAAVREDDTFGKAHYNLAKVYQYMKKWDDAQRHLNRVIALEPQNATHHYELGKCYQHLNRLDMAKSAYEKALGVNPQLYVAHYRLGTVFAAMDQPKKADAAYRKALEINPRFTKGFVSLAMLYLNYDYAEPAMQVLQTGVAINDSSPEAHNTLGVSYQFLKQYDKFGTGEPSTFAELGYVAAQFLDLALRKVHGDTSNKARFLAAMASIGTWQSPGGKLTMDPKTHNVVEPVYLRNVVKRGSGYTQPLVSTLGIFKEPGA